MDRALGNPLGNPLAIVRTREAPPVPPAPIAVGVIRASSFTPDKWVRLEGQSLPSDDKLREALGPNTAAATLARTPSPISTETNQVACRFSADGKYFVSTGGGASTHSTLIYRINGSTFTRLPNLDVALPSSIYDVSLSADGVYLCAVGTASPFIYLYKRTGDQFERLPDPAEIPPAGSLSCSFSPDGQLLAIGHVNAPRVSIYIVGSFLKAPNISGISSDANEVSFSSCSNYLCIATQASPCLYAFRRNGQSFAPLSIPTLSPVPTVGYSCDISDDGKYLFFLSNNSLFSLSRAEDAYTKLSNASFTANGSHSVSCSKNAETVICTAGNALRAFKFSGSSLVNIGLSIGSSVNKAAISPDSNFIAYTASPSSGHMMAVYGTDQIILPNIPDYIMRIEE